MPKCSHGGRRLQDDAQRSAAGSRESKPPLLDASLHVCTDLLQEDAALDGCRVLQHHADPLMEV